jgi:catechol 2,3-dioxygenase-like lactoylglutathione lyase family enzyme
VRWLFDHVVIVVRDLDKAIGDYERAGFSVVRGGRHPDTSAVNGLIGLDGESYLELFSFADPAKAPRHHANWPPFESGGGFGSFWYRTSGIVDDVVRMRSAGVRAEDSRVGSRVRPDGFEVKFRLMVPSRDEFPHAPALIEDVTPLAERLPMPTPHRIGACRVSTISCVVPDLQKAATFYAGMLGRPAAVEGRTLCVKMGATLLRLIEHAGPAVGVQSIEVQTSMGLRAVIGPNTEIPIFS